MQYPSLVSYRIPHCQTGNREEYIILDLLYKLWVKIMRKSSNLLRDLQFSLPAISRQMFSIRHTLLSAIVTVVCVSYSNFREFPPWVNLPSLSLTFSPQTSNYVLAFSFIISFPTTSANCIDSILSYLREDESGESPLIKIFWGNAITHRYWWEERLREWRDIKIFMRDSTSLQCKDIFAIALGKMCMLVIMVTNKTVSVGQAVIVTGTFRCLYHLS